MFSILFPEDNVQAKPQAGIRAVLCSDTVPRPGAAHDQRQQDVDNNNSTEHDR